MTVEHLGLAVVTKESLEMYPSLVQSWQAISHSNSYQSQQRQHQILGSEDTDLELMVCLQLPPICWTVNMYHYAQQ